MRRRPFLLALAILLAVCASDVIGAAEPAVPVTTALAGKDWLIDPSPYRARVSRSPDGRAVVLENGLIRRVVRLAPNAATVAYDNLITGQSILRSVRPEAVVKIDGMKYSVGGLSGQPVHNYLDARWIEQLKADRGAFQFKSIEIGKTRERFPWKKRSEWMPRDLPWPPPGASVVISFAAPKPGEQSGEEARKAVAAQSIVVEVHYEIYDGMPVLAKWIEVHNGRDKPIRLNSFVSEILAAVETDSVVDPTVRWEGPQIMVDTDYTFGGMSPPNHGAAVFWAPDPQYETQVNYEKKTPCLLECRPPRGPDQLIRPGGSFGSFYTFELAYDSTDRERRGLAMRRMYRWLAPWVTENPILMHVRGAEPAAVRLAVDQCADVGFEMIIMTFGSGFDFENRDPRYQAAIKELANYARSKGIALGGYSLLASRGAGTDADNTQGSPARFGVMPCLGARWGVEYLKQLRHFVKAARLGVLEHDGSYPGDFCAATNHPFHHGLDDSQWVMWRTITDFYKWCRAEGVYLNIPDWYFLNGGSKTAMGYREDNWSLPRAYQEVIERQNIYDGTWEKTPSMGWMFVPLTEYQGGGAAATIEPLKEHLPHYEQRLANLFGAGVQACYRGPQLYDSPETREIVKKWVDFYKKHRPILDSDVVHLRRADGRSIDYLLHVNPALRERGLLMVYNPLDRAVEKTLAVPLYYTGLTASVKVSERDGTPQELQLDRQYRIALPVKVAPRGVTWFVLE
jgi:hypothetical protein